MGKQGPVLGPWQLGLGGSAWRPAAVHDFRFHPPPRPVEHLHSAYGRQGAFDLRTLRRQLRRVEHLARGYHLFMLEAIGHYRIRQRIGQGAMGVVYEGWDERLHRPVAVKTIDETNE